MNKKRKPRYFVLPFNGDNLVRAYSISNATKFFLYRVSETIKHATRPATEDEIVSMVKRGITPIDATGESEDGVDALRGSAPNASAV